MARISVEQYFSKLNYSVSYDIVRESRYMQRSKAKFVFLFMLMAVSIISLGNTGGVHSFTVPSLPAKARALLSAQGQVYMAPGLPSANSSNNSSDQVLQSNRTLFIVALDGSGNFTDIQQAIDALPSEGGTVLVKAGLFDLNPEAETHPVWPWKHITVRSFLTLQGEGIDRTIIRQFPTKQALGSQMRYDFVTTTGDTDHVTMEDLTLVQNGSPDNQGWQGICFRQGTNHTNVTIRNVKVTDTYCAAIAIPHFQNFTIEDCFIDHAWTGITVLDGSFAFIKGNTVKDTAGDAIFPQAGTNSSTHCTDIVVENNDIENVGDTAIDVTSGAVPHKRIVVRNNTIKNANTAIRISNVIDIQVTANKIENGAIYVDAGAGRPVRVKIDANYIVSNNTVGIGFYGAQDSSATNNMVLMKPPGQATKQSGIEAAIWGTGLIENNSIINPANYGLTFARWGLGGGNNITISKNKFEGFGEAGIWDEGLHLEAVSILDNVFYSDKQTASWGVLVGSTVNRWLIEHNAFKVNGLSGTGAISAPNSILLANYVYSP